MSSKTRPARQPEPMRRKILVAARRLFVREGYAHVSMRRIAADIDYSAAALYLYFPAKADIFYALAEESFGRLEELLAEPGRGEDALATLEDRVWRYYEFSRKQPELFWLMFVDRSVPRLSREWEKLAFVRRLQAEGTAMVRRSVDAGLFPRGTNAEAAFQVLTTAMHGAAVSRLCGRFVRRADADALARDAVRATIAGLRAGVALEFHAPPAPR
jgi:AcrR family transcriptional regulator